MRSLRKLTTPSLLVLVAGLTGVQAQAPEPTTTTLTELRAHPGRFLAQRLVLTLQFSELVPSWNPYVTRFGPPEYLGFEAWGDERFLWEPEAFDDPAARLFALRGSAAADLLAHALPYERFRVEAVAREVFLDEPWLEIVGVERLDGAVGDGTLLHTGRALQAMEEERWTFALDQLERANAAPLAAHAQAELARLIDECKTALDLRSD
jgi:hypothetical protein